jgi:hypothetical protein
MELTGKCKEDFEKWLRPDILSEHRYSELITNCFSGFPSSMQYGVYVDFFNTKKYEGVELFDKCFSLYFYHKTIFQTHNDIVKQAIEKANEIYNSSLESF